MGRTAGLSPATSAKKIPMTTPKTTTTGMNVVNAIIDTGKAILDEQKDQADKINAANLAAAQYATAMSMAEAQRNRAWEETMWNQTSAFNAAEAQKNRDWQEKMSNTSYQRAVADMKAAGINPILAYSQGGASYGSGSQATVGTLTSGLGSAYQYQAQQAQLNPGSIVSAGILGLTSLGSSAVQALSNILGGIVSLIPGKTPRKIGF